MLFDHTDETSFHDGLAMSPDPFLQLGDTPQTSIAGLLHSLRGQMAPESELELPQDEPLPGQQDFRPFSLDKGGDDFVLFGAGDPDDEDPGTPVDDIEVIGGRGGFGSATSVTIGDNDGQGGSMTWAAADAAVGYPKTLTDQTVGMPVKTERLIA